MSARGSNGTHRLVFLAVLSAAALALSWAERLIPISLIVPVPGVKLGFANIATLYALVYGSRRDAAAVVFVRCALAALLFGSGVSFAFSISGAFCALGIMAALRKFEPEKVSLYGMSVAGAAFHSAGQLAAASVIMRGTAVLSYLPVMLAMAVPCGMFTGFVAAAVFPRLPHFSVSRGNL